MTSDRALLDTNVLVYAMDPNDKRHAACYALLERTGAPASGLCLAPACSRSSTAWSRIRRRFRRLARSQTRLTP